MTVPSQSIACNTVTTSSNPNLSLSSSHATLSDNLTPHIYLTILISALNNASSFSLLTGQVSLPRSKQLPTQLLYTIPFNLNPFAVRKVDNCLNLFQPLRILAVTAASALLNISPR